MKNLNEIIPIETQTDAEQKAIAELKALFEPIDKEGSNALAVQTQSKEKPLFFDRFKGKIKISLS